MRKKSRRKKRNHINPNWPIVINRETLHSLKYISFSSHPLGAPAGSHTNLLPSSSIQILSPKSTQHGMLFLQNPSKFSSSPVYYSLFPVQSTKPSVEPYSKLPQLFWEITYVFWKISHVIIWVHLSIHFSSLEIKAE